MPPLRKPDRILCINCNICVNTFRRYLVLELNTRVISLLSEWISPRIITEEDYICEPCNNLLMRSVNEQLATSCDNAQASGSSQQGRRQVCSLCGRSILNRQSHPIVIDNPSEEQIQILAVIQSRITPRQVSSYDKICHSCWMSCKRAALRTQQVDNIRRVPIEDVEVEAEADTIATEPVTQNVEVPTLPTEASSSEITLENYRRAANTASHCLFPNCGNTSLHNMTDSFRAMVLSTYKYYIPIHSRVCTEHRTSNEWANLYDFTPQQVEHIFSFVNAYKPCLDFSKVESIHEIEENIFFFWTGRTKQDFFTLLEEVPRIREMHKGMLALAAFLIKIRTGESDVRLSTLLDVPRSTLERLMNKCREILIQDFVPRNLGITHMAREQLMEHNLTIPNDKKVALL
ncbi:uncharacterized protein LOC123701151 [Colias croceus]|uniref:uncharacterized protein LOC123701151 n=1 Tax=Colias crocea TaxID=72248 RepID=UPI001E27E344|nr:uncharacterized protein LOC123701151 [Colias croceus]